MNSTTRSCAFSEIPSDKNDSPVTNIFENFKFILAPGHSKRFWICRKMFLDYFKNVYVSYFVIYTPN